MQLRSRFVDYEVVILNVEVNRCRRMGGEDYVLLRTQGKHLLISLQKLSPDQLGISMASTPRSLRKSERNPLGSSESGRIQKCRANCRRRLIANPCAAHVARSRPSASSRSLSRVLKASHRRRLMSVMESPIKMQRPSLNADAMTRLAKLMAPADVDQYWTSVNTSICS